MVAPGRGSSNRRCQLCLIAAASQVITLELLGRRVCYMWMHVLSIFCMFNEFELSFVDANRDPELSH